MVRRTFLRTVSIALSVVAMAAAARAQVAATSLDPAAAASRRLLLEQAQAARVAGRHEDALDRARRAAEILPTSSVLRFVAEEQFALGRSADALATADSCVTQATREPPSVNRDAVAEGCRMLIQQARSRLAQIVLQPSLRPAGLELRVGGVVVPSALIGSPYFVTPGHLSVEAIAPGFEPWRQEIDVRQGPPQPVAIALTRLPFAPATGSVLPSPAGPPFLGTQSIVSPAPTGGVERVIERRTIVVERVSGERRRARSPVGFIVGGAGLALAAAGAGLRIASELDYQSLRTQCLGSAGCSPVTAARRQQSIRTLDLLGVVGLIVGGVATAAGTVMIFAVPGAVEAPAPPTPSPNLATTISPSVAVSGDGVTATLAGTF